MTLIFSNVDAATVEPFANDLLTAFINSSGLSQDAVSISIDNTIGAAVVTFTISETMTSGTQSYITSQAFVDNFYTELQTINLEAYALSQGTGGVVSNLVFFSSVLCNKQL